jgi:hypothetical protein
VHRGCSWGDSDSDHPELERASGDRLQREAAVPGLRRFCRASRRRSRSRYSRSTSVPVRARISLFGTITRSRASPSRLFLRKLSRNSRFERLRAIAPPSRRPATRPRRSWPIPFDSAIRRNSGPSIRRPTRKALRNAAASLRRSRGDRRPVPAGRLRSDSLAPLLAASLEDEPATLGPHPDQEAVGPLPLAIVRLERPLHGSWCPWFLVASPSRPWTKLHSLRRRPPLVNRAPFLGPRSPCFSGLSCDTLHPLGRRQIPARTTALHYGFSTVVEISVQKDGRGRPAGSTCWPGAHNVFIGNGLVLVTSARSVSPGAVCRSR